MGKIICEPHYAYTLIILRWVYNIIYISVSFDCSHRILQNDIIISIRSGLTEIQLNENPSDDVKMYFIDLSKSLFNYFGTSILNNNIIII